MLFRSKTVKKTAKTKRGKKQLFCVEVYSTFRLQYLVEATSADAAERRIFLSHRYQSDNPPEEWQQTHLGEQIVSVSPMTPKQAAQEHTRPDPNGTKSSWLPVERFILRDDG